MLRGLGWGSKGFCIRRYEESDEEAWTGAAAAAAAGGGGVTFSQLLQVIGGWITLQKSTAV
jgi:hypothetical protein